MKIQRRFYNLIELLLAGVLIVLAANLIGAAYFRSHKGLRDAMERMATIRELQIFEQRFRNAPTAAEAIRIVPRNFRCTTGIEEPAEGGKLFVATLSTGLRDHSQHAKTRPLAVRFVRQMETE